MQQLRNRNSDSEPRNCAVPIDEAAHFERLMWGQPCGSPIEEIGSFDPVNFIALSQTRKWTRSGELADSKPEVERKVSIFRKGAVTPSGSRRNTAHPTLFAPATKQLRCRLSTGGHISMVAVLRVLPTKSR
jgi:hypothetical protein